MVLALKDIMRKEEGASRQDVEASLDFISNQLDMLDRKLKNRVDQEVWKIFQQKQEEIQKIEKNIRDILKNEMK